MGSGKLFWTGPSPRFYGEGVGILAVSGQSPSPPICGLTQGPSWWHAHLSAKTDSSEFFWETCSLLLAPPESSQLVVSGSTALLTGVSCCETTHVNGYCYYGLLLCLAENGGFSYQFPNTTSFKKL